MLTHYVHFTTLLWELGSVLSELAFHCDEQFKIRPGWYKRAISISNAHSTLGIWMVIYQKSPQGKMTCSLRLRLKEWESAL